MENWLVRSNMNVHRHPTIDRREPVQSNALCRCGGRLPQHPPRGYTGGDRPTRNRRSRHPALLGEFVTDEDALVADFHHDVKKEDSVHQPCCDGYLTSAQLLLHPGTSTIVSGDYRLMIWDSLVSAVQLIHEDIACPICLHPPVFPRMERCGHVYCGPCLIQYVRHENNSSAKRCAVCSWIIRLDELKRVKLIRVSPISVGCSVNLVLLKRCSADRRCDDLIPVGSTANNNFPFESYEFLKEITSEKIVSEAADEIDALRAYKTSCIEEGDVEIIPFVGSLINDVESELRNAVSQNTSGTGSSVGIDSKLTNAKDVESASADRLPVGEPVYFYQACDGQPVFLDGLMWKCLFTEYGDVLKLPETLSVTVTGVKTYKMNPMLRRRWRYLNHIPWGRTFSMIEIDLEPHVSRTTLERFSSALNVRLAEQNRRQLEDLRLTQLKEAAENRLPTLPEGFKLSGHAELSDQRLPDLSEFVPLGTVTPVQCKPTTSFAEVTRMGAKSVVDSKRIANFARKSATQQQPNTFNTLTEFWPSLVPSSVDNRVHRPDSWQSCLIDTKGSFASAVSTDNSSVKEPSKRRKKKRSRFLDVT